MNFELKFDGASIRTEKDFHEELRHQSGIEWYGANLDALWDMLIQIIPSAWGPFGITWQNYDLSMPTEQNRKTHILGILKEAEEHVSDRVKRVQLTFSKPVFSEWDDPFREWQEQQK